MKYEECKKILNRIRFEKAIAIDEPTDESIVSHLDINSISMF